jgi:hypothetical protein
MVRIQITIDAELEDDELKARSPLMKILKVLSKEEDSQVKWYMENRDRILAQKKEERVVYKVEKAKRKKREEAPVNEIVYPVPPADNILRFN